MAGKIGYKNLFTTSGVTVSASDEAAGYPKENAYDWLSYDSWGQSALGTSWLRASFVSAKTADYMAVWGHNLADVGGSAQPQYSTDGGTIWNDAATAVAPTTNRTLFFSFASTSAADWRCKIVTTTGVSYVSGIQIGDVLTLQTGMRPGFLPPNMNQETTLTTYRSEKGVFLGGSKIREGIAGSINLTLLTPAWVRSDWEPFLDHCRTPYPFVFSWDSTNHPTEAVFAYVKDGKVRGPVYSSTLYMDASLDIEGTL
jgi:hypothetical protein